jgi:hypothetical protein
MNSFFEKIYLFILSTWKLTVGYIILLSLPNMYLSGWLGAWVRRGGRVQQIFLCIYYSDLYMNANSKNLCNSSKLAALDFWISSCFVAYAPRAKSFNLCGVYGKYWTIHQTLQARFSNKMEYIWERERRQRGDGLRTWLALLDLLEPTIVLSSCSRQPIVRGNKISQIRSKSTTGRVHTWFTCSV